MIRFLLLALITAVGSVQQSRPPTPIGKVLPVDLEPQHGRYWCWAATTAMIARYVDPKVDTASISQCSQANARQSLHDCCVRPIPTHCDAGGWPDFPRLGFQRPRVTSNAPVSWIALKTEITANRPIAFSWHWVNAQDQPGPDGHMMVAIGFAETASDSTVFILDPAPLDTGRLVRQIAYSAYVRMSRDHTHWNDYYEIRR